ncbi:hypothetical protein [Actinoallomurus sp. NPDC050550]
MATSPWEPSGVCDIATERPIGRFDLIPPETGVQLIKRSGEAHPWNC